MSKKFKGKACVYCGIADISESGDHVIARSFFLEEDRANLPQVPACITCNRLKSALETEIAASLLIGSKHAEGNRYRREMVKPRLDKNARLRRTTGLNEPPQWVSVNGVLQRMHAIKVDAEAIGRLMNFILKGLFFYEFGELLDPAWDSDVTMIHPDREAELWASMSHFFPPGTKIVERNLGRGSFIYIGRKSGVHTAFTVWQFAWHNGITLHGDGAPVKGASRWWGVTRPTPEALAAEQLRAT